MAALYKILVSSKYQTSQYCQQNIPNLRHIYEFGEAIISSIMVNDADMIFCWSKAGKKPLKQPKFLTSFLQTHLCRAMFKL